MRTFRKQYKLLDALEILCGTKEYEENIKYCADLYNIQTYVQRSANFGHILFALRESR